MLFFTLFFVFCGEYWQPNPPAAAIANTREEAEKYWKILTSALNTPQLFERFGDEFGQTVEFCNTLGGILLNRVSYKGLMYKVFVANRTADNLTVSDLESLLGCYERIALKNSTKVPSLAGVPSDVKKIVASFLSHEEEGGLDAFTMTSHSSKVAGREAIVDEYVECLLKDQPVPESVMKILNNIIQRGNKETKETKQSKALIGQIASLIKYKLGTKILKLTIPMPEFLEKFFRKVTSADFSQVCEQTVSNGAFEHMKKGRTYWVPSSETTLDKIAPPEEEVEKIREIAGQYMTLEQAIKPDASPTKYIVATALAATDNHEDINRLFEAHPGSVLIIDFGDSPLIPTSFNISALNKVAHVSFVGAKVTSIGNNFLYGCWSLQSVDLSALSNLTSIGNNFLCGCESLQSVDLSALSNLTSIGNNFLYGCWFLQSVDLSALSNLTSIGVGCLVNCLSLQSVDLNALRNLTSIGQGFLFNCGSLQSINLRACSNLTSIGFGFLKDCRSLTSIDLSALSNLTSVSAMFLDGCSSLASVDLSAFSKVASIGDQFLSGCSSLASIFVGPKDSALAKLAQKAIAEGDHSKIQYAERP